MSRTRKPETIPVVIDADLADKLTQAAQSLGLTREAFAADSLAQAVETALRHRVVLQRVESVDRAILELAEFLGELKAAAETASAATVKPICRYQPGANSEDEAA